MIQEPLSHPNAPYRAFALLLASECVHRIHGQNAPTQYIKLYITSI
jgi:hypothetical protein